MLRNQVIRDPVTGLFNRRYMTESLEREVHRAIRNQTPLGIVMLDVDNFKPLNDRLGHDAGDRLLRALGEFLRTHTRGHDIACRYGGDEFTLILPGASLDVTRRRAEQLREEFKRLRVKYPDPALGGVTLSMASRPSPITGRAGRSCSRRPMPRSTGPSATGAIGWRAARGARNRKPTSTPQPEPVAGRPVAWRVLVPAARAPAGLHP